MVTETRVDNNLKQAKLTAIINNHTTTMCKTNLSSATKHHKTRLPLDMHASKQIIEQSTTAANKVVQAISTANKKMLIIIATNN